MLVLSHKVFLFIFVTFSFTDEEKKKKKTVLGGLLLVCSQGGTVYTSEPGSTGGSQEQIYDQ